jgi:hypothetical protein
VQCRLDLNTYDKGIKISDDEMAKPNISPADFHGGRSLAVDQNFVTLAQGRPPRKVVCPDLGRVVSGSLSAAAASPFLGGGAEPGDQRHG